VFLGLCRGSRVVQGYTNTGVVQEYNGPEVVRGTGVVPVQYRVIGVVPWYLCCAGVQMYYRGTGMQE